MRCSRRGFVGGCAAFLGGSCFSYAGLPGSRRRLTVGVISDIHISDMPLVGGTSLTTFRAALEYYRDRGVDAVLIAGDLADWGLICQLEAVAKVWYEVFPSDRGADGRRVEKVFVYGNHDIDGTALLSNPARELIPDPEELRAQAIVSDRQKVWERIFHEPWAPVFRKTVNGYDFIGAHYVDDKNCPELPAFMKRQGGLLDPERPFFFTQHLHPRHTCFGDWALWEDDGTATRVLSDYPNCVAFSGHSHYSLTDERSIWQGAFTSVSTASLRYLVAHKYRLNTGFKKRDAAKNPWHIYRPEAVPGSGGRHYDGRQGLVMEVYDDRIVLERRDFLHLGVKLADDWVIPLPAAKHRVYDFPRRIAEAVAPQFAAGAKVSITANIDGTGEDAGRTFVRLSFPTAHATAVTPRVFEYEIQIETRRNDFIGVVATHRLAADKWYLPETMMPPVDGVLLPEADLPEDEYRFVVRPLESFANKGEPIYSEWCPPRKKEG